MNFARILEKSFCRAPLDGRFYPPTTGITKTKNFYNEKNKNNFNEISMKDVTYDKT